MPSKKRKYNARFPAGRIKKIMRIDDDIGKVALPVPVMISRAVELFVYSLLHKARSITMQKNARTLTLTHLKQSIYSDNRLNFLKELVKNVPDCSEELNDNNFAELSVTTKKHITNNDSDDEEMSSRTVDRGSRPYSDGNGTIEQHLSDCGGCLCRLSLDACVQQLRTRPPTAARDATTHLSAMRSLLSARRRQSRTGRGCPTVKRVCSALVPSDPTWPSYLLDALRSAADPYAGHAAVCAASETALCPHADSATRTRLIDGLLRLSAGPSAPAAARAVGALTRVLDASDDDASDDDASDDDASDDDDDDDDNDDGEPAAASRLPPGTFCAGDAERSAAAARNTKTLLLDQAHECWPHVVHAIVSRNDDGDADDRGATAAALAELLRLWMSVFAADPGSRPRRPHYLAHLVHLQHVLYRTDTDRHVWLNTVRLFGAGLSRPRLSAAEEPSAAEASLAGHVVDGVTRRRLLYFMGKLRDGDGDVVGVGHRVAQDTALLAMRSLRVFACAAGGRGDAPAAITAVVDCLDSYVNSAGMYPPDVRFCRWLVRLMLDRDDAVVECLMCALDVADAAPAVRPPLEPFEGFAEFLACVSYDPDVLLDFLISDENEFLTYALRILKAARADPDHFFRCCGDRLENAMESLIRLRLKILRLHGHRVFPYNIGPIAKLIERCDELYSEYIS